MEIPVSKQPNDRSKSELHSQPGYRSEAFDKAFESFASESVPLRSALEEISEGTARSGDGQRSRGDLRSIPLALRKHDRHRRSHPPLPWERFAWLPSWVLGFAVIVFSQLAAWWLPDQQGVDPFGVAPVLPRFLSFAAPEYLRQPLNAAQGTVTSLKPDSENHRHMSSDRSTGTVRIESSTSEEKSAADLAPQLNDAQEVVANQHTGLTAANSVSEGNAATGTKATGQTPVELTELLSPLVRVEEDLDASMNTLRELDALSVEQRRVKAKAFYAGLCTVGGELKIPDSRENYKYIVESQRGVVAAAHSVLAGIATAPEKLMFIARSANRQLEKLTSTEPGILVLGRVKALKESESSSWAMTLVSLVEPRQHFIVDVQPHQLKQTVLTGDLLLVLGRQVSSLSDADFQNVQIAAAVVYPCEATDFAAGFGD